MLKATLKGQEITPDPFHVSFPFALEWYVKNGKKKLQHNAYFPYEDYRDRYAKRLKLDKTIVDIRKYATPSRTN